MFEYKRYVNKYFSGSHERTNHPHIIARHQYVWWLLFKEALTVGLFFNNLKKDHLVNSQTMFTLNNVHNRMNYQCNFTNNGANKYMLTFIGVMGLSKCTADGVISEKAHSKQ